MLEVERISAGYGGKQVLYEVGLHVGEREVVALLGHNGAGKSTLLDVICGMVPAVTGQMSFNGMDLQARPSHTRLAAGIGYLSQGAPVFSRLSVLDNLRMGGYAIADKAVAAHRIEAVERLFPSLFARRSILAGSLSGGERQMLALGTLLIASPSLIILDEPSGGMSPLMVDKLYEAIELVAQTEGTSLLLVEQDVERALAIATRLYVLTNGRVTYAGSAEAARDPAMRAQIMTGLAH